MHVHISGYDSWTTSVPVRPLFVILLLNANEYSQGTRGATSAEYFLKAGYAVIFMHRQFSLQPFSRHYSHSTNPFLDFLEIEDPEAGEPAKISVTQSERERLLGVLKTYKSVQKAGTLLTLSFVTVNDYLWLLRGVSQELSGLLRRDAMYYLAAAVSDFFLPSQKLVSPYLIVSVARNLTPIASQSEHKIQSGKGSLHIEMDQVPKILKPLVDEWTSEGFLVSFKVHNG